MRRNLAAGGRPSRGGLAASWLALAILAVWAVGGRAALAGDSYRGTTERVVDGDTISVLSFDYERVRVRFYGIDAPEKGQPGGAEAAAALKALIEGREVEVETLDVDRYNRGVAWVRLGGRLINEVLVAAGHAWVYEQYCRLAAECRALRSAQAAARAAGLGLWRDPSPIAPWDYRRGQREGSSDGTSGGTSSGTSGGSSIGGRSPRTAPVWPAAPRAGLSAVIAGNVKSRIFHNSSCQHFNCKNCTAVFNDRQQAIAAGYRACRICGG
ncbi:MAG: thermonuclease family protein [Deltaproteobacteria bacterium]|jgi:endonuclease YncB( thermonuclease family)|nr:thermonuclease family protein [Deltaproteobacteria bacterium]